MWISPKTNFSEFELDEIYWFIKSKERTENRSNCYIMTMFSRIPRQIVGFAVDKSVNSKALQRVADSVPSAETYYTDSCQTYMDVVFGGKHIGNPYNNNDTHNIESSNADLRHHISGLSRRSRCFYRTMKTLEAVLSLFIDAYNKFGEKKLQTQKAIKHTSTAKHLHKYRYPSFSVLDFL